MTETRLFVDTEFDGFGGPLMSMAIVSDSGHEWYEVLPTPVIRDKWVRENVFPVLGKKPISMPEFRASLFAFLGIFENPIIVADWYTDIVHFFQCFAGGDHTESHPYACRAELVLIEDYESEVPHNALSDARAIRVSYFNLDHSEESPW